MLFFPSFRINNNIDEYDLIPEKASSCLKIKVYFSECTI